MHPDDALVGLLWLASPPSTPRWRFSALETETMHRIWSPSGSTVGYSQPGRGMLWVSSPRSSPLGAYRRWCGGGTADRLGLSHHLVCQQRFTRVGVPDIQHRWLVS